MKKPLSLIVLLLAALALAACAAAAQSTSDPTALAVGSAGAGTPNPAGQTLPLSTQLLVGTFKLEDSGQAVTPEQARALLPLWQAVQALSNATDAAPQEMEAVVAQIQDSMTADQLDAITAMNLTPNDQRALFEVYGLAPAFPQDGTPRPQRTPNPNATPGAGGFGPGFGGDGGAFVGGAPPDGFPGGPPGGFAGQGGAQGELSTEQLATLEARRAAGGGRLNAGVSTGLVAELIKLLEARAGSQ